MARVTVEDCLKNVKNRFELVLVAAKRARQLMRGKQPKVEWDNDKSTVVALREIALGYVNIDDNDTHEEENQSVEMMPHHAAIAAEEAEAEEEEESAEESTEQPIDTDTPEEDRPAASSDHE